MNCYHTNRKLLALVLIAAMLLTLCACGKKDEPKPTETLPPVTTDIPEKEESRAPFLGNGLYITEIYPYIGLYMEDGTNEEVDNVLMAILKNENDRDLQYAKLELEYADFTAEFEMTNVPAGESVVLLEKNRHEYTEELFRDARVSNVLFFENEMSLQEDKVKITELNGAINVENITDEPLGDMYIYYKYASTDLLYGGITFRSKIKAGLKPGRVYTIMEDRFKPDMCRVIDVQILEETEEFVEPEE